MLKKQYEPVYLYRAITYDHLSLYRSNPEKIPKLKGRAFSKYKKENDLIFYPYQDDVKYLHFFDSREIAKQYAKSLEADVNRKTCIAMFKFDSETLKRAKTEGKFENGDGSYSLVAEYIMPLSDYDPAKHFVGVMEVSEKTPNVYAVLGEEECEFYATNLAAADGTEYLQDERIKQLLDAGYSERAIHLYASREKAEDAIAEDSHDVVIPFLIDESVLKPFEIPFGKKDKEYLLPLSQMSEANYVEEGYVPLKSKEERWSDPDDYGAWGMFGF